VHGAVQDDGADAALAVRRRDPFDPRWIDDRGAVPKLYAREGK